QQNHFAATHVPAKITGLPQMLAKGQISAFEGWETVAAETVLTVPGAHYLPQPFLNNEIVELAASESFIKAHRRATDLVVRDIVKAMKYISACKPQAIGLLAAKMDTPNAQKILETALPQLNITDPNLNVPSAVQWIDLEVKDEKLVSPLAKSNPQGFLAALSDLSF